MVDETHLLTSFQVAVKLGVSPRTVHRMVRDGKLSATKLPGPNGAFVFDREDVEALLKGAA